MKRLLPLIALIIAPCLVQAQNAHVLFQQALRLERSQGDIEGAISLYQQVAESVTSDREQVARALLAMAGSYETIGSDQARATYTRLVTEFPDQPNAFLAAREALVRIVTMQPDRAEIDPTLRQDYTLITEKKSPRIHEGRPRFFDYAPDGSTMIISEIALDYRKAKYPSLERELYFVDSGSSVRRPVVEDFDRDWIWMSHPRWSPDGTHILFLGTWHDEFEKRGVVVRDLESAENVFYNGSIPQWTSIEWMGNSEQYVAMHWTGLKLFSKSGNELKTFEIDYFDRTTRTGNVSADGRFIAYHRNETESALGSEKNIYMLNLETGEETQITTDKGFEAWPTFSRDGKSIYYVSGSQAVLNLYRKEIGSKSPAEKITSYNNARVNHPIVLPRTGQLVFELIRDNHTILAADSDRMGSPSEMMRGEFPRLSPDGRKVFFLDREPGRTGIWSASITGENPEHLVQGMVVRPYSTFPFLSPDGEHLAYFLHESDRTNLYTMPSDGGPSRRLYSAEGKQWLLPGWSPDSREIVFADESDLLVISQNGGSVQKLAQEKDWSSGPPRWSPDGKYIAALAETEADNNPALFVVDRKSGDKKRLTSADQPSVKEIAEWHPDGNRISFMYYDYAGGDGDGSKIVSLEGGDLQTLGAMPGDMWDYIGTWGPDQRYYFQSVHYYNQGWGLYSVDAKNQDFTTVRHLNDRDVSLPTWSRDASKMAWSEKETTWQLWMLTDYE